MTTLSTNPTATAPANEPQSGDEDVLAAVLNALHHNTGVPQDRVKVAVREGHVTLSGAVEQEFERGLAETLTKDVAGVVDVTNQITIES